MVFTSAENWWVSQLQKQMVVMEKSGGYGTEELHAHRKCVVESQLKVHLEQRRKVGIKDADFKCIKHFIKNACQYRDMSSIDEPVNVAYKAWVEVFNRYCNMKNSVKPLAAGVRLWNGVSFVDTNAELALIEEELRVVDAALHATKAYRDAQLPMWFPHRRWWAKGYLKNTKP